MTLHETVPDSFSPKAFLPILEVGRLDSPGRPTLRLQYRGRWDFCHHRGSFYRSRGPGVAAQLESSMGKIKALVAKQNVHLLVSTDLFVEIDQDTETCSYWFADHAHQTVFKF